MQFFIINAQNLVMSYTLKAQIQNNESGDTDLRIALSQIRLALHVLLQQALLCFTALFFLRHFAASWIESQHRNYFTFCNSSGTTLKIMAENLCTVSFVVYCFQSCHVQTNILHYLAIGGGKIWPLYEQLSIFIFICLLATSWPKLRFSIIDLYVLNFLVTFLLLTTNTALQNSLLESGTYAVLENIFGGEMIKCK